MIEFIGYTLLILGSITLCIIIGLAVYGACRLYRRIRGG